MTAVLYRLRQFVIIGVLLSVQLPDVAAQEGVQRTDTIGTQHSFYTFRPTQLILPAALITVGWFGVENGWLCSLKNDVRDRFYDLRGDCRFRLDDRLQYLPVVAHVGMGLIGAPARHPLRERMATTATAYAAMGIMVNSVKYTVRERRPDSGARNSFPSGHSATAFMGAELVRLEYGNVYGAGAYAIAAGIGFMRLYNDRHWLNDVLGGAGVGILSARIAYWLLPWERRLLGWEKKAPAALSVVPAYNPSTKSIALAASLVF